MSIETVNLNTTINRSGYKMPKIKPEGWKEELEGLVKEGKTYAQTQAIMQEKFGEEEGTVGASTFGKLRKSAFPEEKREVAIGEVGEQHAKLKPKKKPLPAWNAQKQKAGDSSQLADVLNQVIFYMAPCPNGKLEFKHVKEINVGGGVVNTISYLFPGLDFSNNPIIVLVIRVALFVIKVRKICYTIKQKGNDIIGAPEDGLNKDFGKTEHEVQDIVDSISTHPLDKPEIKKLWEETG